ncbi:MAG: Hsp20/alpha crystallin family protein [Pseudomonadales bacterium]
MSKSKEAVRVKQAQGKKDWASRMLSPFDVMDREFDSMFRRGWRHPLLGGFNDWKGEPAFEGKVPSVDVIDQDAQVLIKAELPGVDKKDVDVSVTDETVSIKGKSSYDNEEEKGDYYRREISQGSFERVLAIPANVNSAKAKATFRDGMLEISLPKTEKTNRKKVNVQ